MAEYSTVTAGKVTDGINNKHCKYEYTMYDSDSLLFDPWTHLL